MSIFFHLWGRKVFFSELEFSWDKIFVQKQWLQKQFGCFRVRISFRIFQLSFVLFKKNWISKATHGYDSDDNSLSRLTGKTKRLIENKCFWKKKFLNFIYDLNKQNSFASFSLKIRLYIELNFCEIF